MNSFPKSWSVDIATGVDRIVDLMSVSLEPFFNGLSAFISFFLNLFQNLMFMMPWWLLPLLVIAAGWFATRRMLPSLTFGVMVILIGSFGYWEFMIFTLAIVFTSVLFSLLLGLPYGILMAEFPRLEKVTLPILDAMQTMPSWVYLIPSVSFFGLGRVPAVIATMIYALPPVMRLTCHAITHVDAETVEAAQAYGSTRLQSLVKVKIPQAASTIMAGINQTTMMAVAMVVTCAMIGARGLGTEVLHAINRLEVGRGFEAGLSIVFIAIIIDRLTQGLARSLQNQTESKGERSFSLKSVKSRAAENNEPGL